MLSSASSSTSSTSSTFSGETKPSLDNLPDDVLGIIFRQLDLDELIRLKLVGKGISHRVTSLGIPLYLSNHRQSHRTLYPLCSYWNPEYLVRHNHYINQSLNQHRFHALQIGPTWTQAVIPTLTLTSDNLIIGVGGKILSHPLISPLEEYGGKTIGPSREYPIGKRGSGGRADVIGIIPFQNHNQNENEFIVGQFDGTIQRIILPSSGPSIPKITAKYNTAASSSFKQQESIHTIVGNENGDRFMTTSTSGKADIYQTKSPWIEPFSIQLKSSRAWSSLLTTENQSIGAKAMIGVQGSIELYDLLPSGISSNPSRKLIGPEEPLLSSPYDIHLPSQDSSSSSSSSPFSLRNTILSGWYDSHIRLHDIRSSSNLPILNFSDPFTWADGSAFYSTCFMGEYYIAGGGSKHGTVSFFDIRYPNFSKNPSNPSSKKSKSKIGWSCFSPGGKNSPVYKLQSDGGKLWGVTERRSFVLSFDTSGNSKNGILSNELESREKSHVRDRDKGRYVPGGWKGRGGKWNWTVRYDQDEARGAVGYEHRDRGVELFDSLIAV
ncbi:uncharacterized protein IL334_003870 [Kwoniella shivajii]|uniref:F-box domain-containing protein n=1 Tax=Kwoniella shivajii TaxID=564305 RepID=A0ABZ1D0I4_9TREE|nr:hypothetical protein IL334_003870 [Kwoniella shivajii]